MPGAAPARFALLDGLRAVAALSVLVTHVAFYSGFTEDNALGPLTARLNVGVAIFFVLSAFLLYRPRVAARLDGARPPGVRRYALRRVLRIVPAYWAALLILGLALPRFVEGATGGDWWIYFGFLQAYSDDHVVSGLAVAWSLGTEAAFYVALPALAVVAGRVLGGRDRERQVRLELAGIAASVVLAFVLRALAEELGGPATYDTTIAGKWPWFAGGMALAVASVAWAERDTRAPRLVRAVATRPGWCWLAALGVLLVSAALLPRQVFAMTAGELQLETLLFGLVAVLAVAPAVLAGGAGAAASPGGRLLALRPVVWLGVVSYGIFLWHLPLARWVLEWTPSTWFPVVLGIATALAVACAALSWYALERPVLRLADRAPSDRPDRPRDAGAPITEPAP